MIDKKLILICAACFLPSLCGSTELTHQISQAGSSASNVGSHADMTLSAVLMRTARTVSPMSPLNRALVLSGIHILPGKEC